MTPFDTQPVYLIVAQQPLVAQDIAGAIGHEVPGAQVLVAGTIANAVVLLRDVSKVDVAFIEADDSSPAVTSLPEALFLSGTRIVLVGPEQPKRWETLAVPFTSDDLARIIRRMGDL